MLFWNRESEFAAPALFALNGDRPAVLLDDVLYDRQAQTDTVVVFRSLRLDAVVLVKDLLELLFRNPNALVLDRYPDIDWVLHGGQSDDGTLRRILDSVDQ